MARHFVGYGLLGIVLFLGGCAARSATDTPPRAAVANGLPARSTSLPALSPQTQLSTRWADQPAVEDIVLPTDPGSAGQLGADPDGRMLQRRWPQAVALYANGAVPAWPTYYRNLDQPIDRPDWRQALADLGLFLWDTATLPVKLVQNPPWQATVYRGAEQTDPVPGASEVGAP